MAAITSYSEWTSLCKEGAGEPFVGGFGNGAFTGAFPQSAFSRMQNMTNSTVSPGAAVALDNTHSSALIRYPKLPGTSTKTLWLSELEWGMGASTATQTRNVAMLYDRLSHQSGLDGITLTEQTTNLPTAALPRYTDGVGVQAWLEVYAFGGVGSTATTATIRYTNQAGVANRVSQPLVIGGGSGAFGRSHNQSMPFCLQDGDTGVRSVEGFTLAASTGTAGDIGITLLKPLAITPVDSMAQIERTAWRNVLFGGGVVEIKPDACLGLMLFNPVTATSAQSLVGRIGLAKK